MSGMETYQGHVRTPTDAIILFEACRIGLLPRVQRRLSEKERQSIKSGSVFVWDEREAGMRRWTDGKSWSASRVSGSFLTYREMEGKRGGSGFDKTANRDGVQGQDGDSDGGPDGYRYKPDGLMKQSFSITTTDGHHLHLISYYSRQAMTSASLMLPSNDPQLRHIRPEKGMYPESTVHEQSNVPAVTRGPMGSPAYTHSPGQPPPYQRPGPYAYSQPPWPPSPNYTPPPHPPYGSYYGNPYPQHPPYPGPPMHHYPPPHGYAQHPPPPTAFDRPPQPMANPGHPHPHAHPPPPQHSHSYPPPSSYGPPHYAPYSQPYHPPPIHGPPQYPPPPQQHQGPPAYDQRTSASAPAQAERPKDATSSQTPPHGPTPPKGPEDKQPAPPAPSSSGQTIPSISAMLNAGENGQPPQRKNSRSPNGTPPRPLQDIPSHKLGFEANRDMHTLRNLDKSTFKY